MRPPFFNCRVRLSLGPAPHDAEVVRPHITWRFPLFRFGDSTSVISSQFFNARLKLGCSAEAENCRRLLRQNNPQHRANPSIKRINFRRCLHGPTLPYGPADLAKRRISVIAQSSGCDRLNAVSLYPPAASMCLLRPTPSPRRFLCRQRFQTVFWRLPEARISTAPPRRHRRTRHSASRSCRSRTTRSRCSHQRRWSLGFALAKSINIFRAGAESAVDVKNNGQDYKEHPFG